MAVVVDAPTEGGLLFTREDGECGCPRCGTTLATTNRERPTDCPVCDYDRVVNDAVEQALKVVSIDRAGTRRRVAPKVGRNDPCGCGSGRKAKRCCHA